MKQTTSFFLLSIFFVGIVHLCFEPTLGLKELSASQIASEVINGSKIDVYLTTEPSIVGQTIALIDLDGHRKGFLPWNENSERTLGCIKGLKIRCVSSSLTLIQGILMIIALGAAYGLSKKMAIRQKLLTDRQQESN